MKSFYEFCGSSTWIGDFSLRKTTTQTQTTEYMKNEKLWNQNVIYLKCDVMISPFKWNFCLINLSMFMKIDCWKH